MNRADEVIRQMRGAGTSNRKADRLICIRTDLEALGGERAVQKLQAVEFCCTRDAIQFLLQLVDFRLQRRAIRRGICRIRRLDCQLANTLQKGAAF